MIRYWSGEDNWFIVEVPELPGCIADDGTYEEAVKSFCYDQEMDGNCKATWQDDS